MTRNSTPGQIIHGKLLDRIRDGTYHERLPTMRALAGEFQVNLKTIQKVIGRLREEGLVMARQGSAVYVSGRGQPPLSAEKRRRPSRLESAGVRVGMVCDAYGRGDRGYHPYFSECIRGVLDAAQKARMDLRFIPTPSYGYLGQDPDYFRKHVLDAGLRGVISMSAGKKEVQRFLKHGLSFVACGDHLKLPADMASYRVPRLIHRWDDDIYDATRRIIARGHRRIALLGQKGLAGFGRAMEEYDLKVPEDWRTQLGANGEAAGFEACRRLCAQSPRPTAIMVTDDFTCRGALMALMEARIEIPRDISVVSLANAASDLHMFRPISTVEVDGQKEGARYVQVLAAELERATPSGSGVAGKDIWPLHAKFMDRGSLTTPPEKE